MLMCKKCDKKLSKSWKYCPWCGQKQDKPVRKWSEIKRENGAGSIYKRSDRKNRPWVALTPQIKLQKRQVIGHYDTAQQAKDALDNYRRNPTDRLNITVKELYEEWKPLGYKDKSKQLKDCYNAAWKKLEPIYKLKFRELRTAQMQRIIEDWQKERPLLDKNGNQIIKNNKLQTIKPQSYSSLSKIKILLGLLYQYAMQNDIVNKNYAEFLVLPKKGLGVKDCFNELELKKIENAAFGINGAEKIQFADCILFMCYTGLRITEFLMLSKIQCLWK